MKIFDKLALQQKYLLLRSAFGQNFRYIAFAPAIQTFSCCFEFGFGFAFSCSFSRLKNF